MTPLKRHVGTALEILVPLLVLAVLIVWSANADSFFFPPVTEILVTFRETWLFDRAASDVVPSLARMAAGYVIACVVGIALGTVLGLVSWLRTAVSPIVEFLRAIPPTALIPFAIVVIGIGDDMRVFIIAFVCVWPVLLNTIDGVAGIEQTTTDTARIFGVRGSERLRYVVLPAASPQIAAGMRSSLALALILMVISEMVASTNGIGFFVIQSQRTFAIPEMWSGTLLLGLLGFLLNAAFLAVERRVLAWHRGARDR